MRDHGAGIPEAASEQLFEQFFTTKEEGLGMGLAIVRSIVEAHGGKIAAENAPDGGARFYFTLPAARRHNGPRAIGIRDRRSLFRVRLTKRRIKATSLACLEGRPRRKFQGEVRKGNLHRLVF